MFDGQAHFGRIGHDEGQSGGDVEAQPGNPGNGANHLRLHGFDQPAEIDRLEAVKGIARERHDLVHDAGGALGGRKRIADVALGGVIVGEVAERDGAFADNTGQHVVEVVGNAGGHDRQAAHALGPVQAPFELFVNRFPLLPAGNVHARAEHPANSVLLVEQGGGEVDQVHGAAVRPLDAGFLANYGLPGCRRHAHGELLRGEFFSVGEYAVVSQGVVHLQETGSFRRGSKGLGERGIDADGAALGLVGHSDADRNYIEERFEIFHPAAQLPIEPGGFRLAALAPGDLDAQFGVGALKSGRAALGKKEEHAEGIQERTDSRGNRKDRGTERREVLGRDAQVQGPIAIGKRNCRVRQSDAALVREGRARVDDLRPVADGNGILGRKLPLDAGFDQGLDFVNGEDIAGRFGIRRTGRGHADLKGRPALGRIENIGKRRRPPRPSRQPDLTRGPANGGGAGPGCLG